MRLIRFSYIIAVSLLEASILFTASRAPAEGQPGAMDAAAIKKLTGAKGAFDQKENVFKVSMPRSDLSVTIHGVKMTPPMGLTSWAAFMREGKDDMVMGDLVLTQEQISVRRFLICPSICTSGSSSSTIPSKLKR
jgi:hypothetical protein